MARCYFCGEETSNENLERLDDTLVRVCDNCKETQAIGELVTLPLEELNETKGVENENNEH